MTIGKDGRTGFDNDKYKKLQSEKIKERIERFGGKLYLEFGGKLYDDYHASRVLPGFEPDSKMKMLLELKDQAEIIVVINSGDIEKNKKRSDIGITYDADVLRLIDVFRHFGLYVGGVVITFFENQPAAVSFQEKLESLGVKVYRHYAIPGYPSDVERIVSEEGYGKNEFIETERPLAVVTAPGPGSGKMAVCLSQVYNELKRGVRAGYAKFETFPVWNLPLRHPVNIAYEAATTDLADVNMIDPFHLEAYGTTAVNYNRDVEIFPVLTAIFEKIYGTCPYKSPTDMGVNMAGFCITNDEAVREAANQEIIRRYYGALRSIREGNAPPDLIYKHELQMKQAGLSTADRPVVAAALAKAKETGAPATAIQLADGRIITGKTSNLLGATSACLVNALKALAGIDDSLHLLSPNVITPIQHLKIEHLGNHNPRLHTDEVLIALSVCGVSSPEAERAVDMLDRLHGCDCHSTVILSQVDENLLRKIGVHLTSEPVYQTKKLYHK
ncbi:MAG: DUF1846 domain-containing protein [Clostridia bacterium]|nr:DUF1846 domain-containing protein [Clostridia bacterium]